MIGLPMQILGSVAGLSTIAAGTLFMLNKDKAADLKRAKADIEVLEQNQVTLESHIKLLEANALQRLEDEARLDEEEEVLEDALQIEDPDARRLAVGCAIMRQQAEAGTRSAPLPSFCRLVSPVGASVS